jgi:hypothetical protein
MTAPRSNSAESQCAELGISRLLLYFGLVASFVWGADQASRTPVSLSCARRRTEALPCNHTYCSVAAKAFASASTPRSHSITICCNRRTVRAVVRAGPGAQPSP